MHNVEQCGSSAVCGICGSGSHSTALKFQAYSIMQCKDCGQYYLSPLPKQETMAGSYGKEYFASHRTIAPKTNAKLAEKIKAGERELEKIREVACMEDVHKVRLLDVGSGNGSFLYAAKKNNWDAAGIDISEWAVKHAKKTLGIDVLNTSIDKAYFEKESFDVVSFQHTLEHFPKPLDALVKARGWLRGNGLLFVKLPNISCYTMRGLRNYWKTPPELDIPSHLYFFTPASASALVERAGFEIIKTEISERKLSKLRHRLLWFLYGRYYGQKEITIYARKREGC